jgi:predicted transcriptional regulator
VVPVGVKAAKQRAKKGIVEAVQYALGHRIRIQVLILLNEGIYTASEIAEIIDVPRNTLHNHLTQMLEDGTIEIAKEESRRNFTTYWFKAVEVAFYDKKAFGRLPFVQRQNIAGAIVQSATAEVVAGLDSGKLASNEAVCYWDWFNLDEEGREKAEQLSIKYLDDLKAIEAEAINRTAKTKKATKSFLLNHMWFERPRRGGQHLRPTLGIHDSEGSYVRES